MRSTAKAILFSRVTVGKQVKQYPVAVFSDKAGASHYATILHMAHRANDPDAAKKLDPQTPLTDDGKLHTDTRWSVTEVPYQPVADLGAVDTPETPAPATT